MSASTDKALRNAIKGLDDAVASLSQPDYLAVLEDLKDSIESRIECVEQEIEEAENEAAADEAEDASLDEDDEDLYPHR